MYDLVTYARPTALAVEAVKSVVVIECYTPADNNIATTAGFVVSEHGHIVTVAHGLTECTNKKQRNIRVRFWEDPSKAFRAVIVRMDAEKDVAILQVPLTPTDIVPLRVDFSLQQQGESTIAIGHPFLFYWSMSKGIISADRIWMSPFKHLIQVDTPINPGNSGGPILNEEGRVIGIASFNIGGNPTVSFLVPMDTVASVARGIYF